LLTRAALSATVDGMAEASAVQRLPEPDPVFGADAMPEELFEQLLAESGERNGAAYTVLADAEATWS
ncbi:MAG: hypothetical protein ACJ786_14650, partial [Catenulispora sp.]